MTEAGRSSSGGTPRRHNPLLASRRVTTVSDLPLLDSGKVREMYDLGDRLLMVASDRISTYDVVHPNPIPDKGKVLTGLSAFWFSRTEHIVPNHFISATDGVPDEARGRAIVAKKLRMLPVECIVRGYITGSGWKDYQATGKVSGIELPPGPAGVREAPEADLHAVDQGRDRRPRRDDLVRPGRRRDRRRRPRRAPARRLDRALLVRRRARAARGVILADTKFEFGLDEDGELVVGDEVLTPDSSRYWPADGYEVGHGQPSFDKQYVRDWASAPAGTRRRRRPRSPPRSSTAPARATSRPTRRSPASRSTPGSSGRRREAPRARPAQGGHPRPAGHRRRARAAGARLRGRRQRPRRAG